MSHDIPLGKKEGPRLEFKEAAALKAPEVLGRGIVAMLNAEGGEVWVGLRKEKERAVAIDPIADPEGERCRLLDHLVDAIEPWLSAEIEVESQLSEEGCVLRIVARPEPRQRPYALLKSGGRQYVIRVGPRIRPMTREELKWRFSERASMPPSYEEQALADAKGRLAWQREQIQKLGGQRFWLGLEPELVSARSLGRLGTLTTCPDQGGDKTSSAPTQKPPAAAQGSALSSFVAGDSRWATQDDKGKDIAN